MSISISDVYASQCPSNIYESKSEEEWVSCKKRKNFIGMIIAIIVIIIIAIIILFTANMGIKIAAAAVSIFVISAIVLSHFIWTPLVARTEYGKFRRDVGILVNSGLSEADAINKLRSEHVTKDLLTPTQHASQTSTIVPASLGIMTGVALRGLTTK